jgi:polyhydroxybutyrate depolymerase
MRLTCQSAALMIVCSVFSSCGGGGGSNNTQPASAVSTCSAQDPECHSIAVSGVTRTYVLHLPAGFQMGTGSLVVVLHGSGQNAAGIEDLSQFRVKADAAGFAVAFPEGLVQNSTEPEWSFYYNNFVDDIGFLRQLIAKLQADLQVPIGRTYVTGISAGGLMTHRVGIELSNQISAIAVVSGAVAANPGDSPSHPSLPQSPAGPVSVLILHGDQDAKVPYCGGISTTGHANFSSQEETFNYWTAAAANNCSSFDTALPLCDAQGNITAIVEKDATSCRTNTEVKLFRLTGGQHNWYNSSMNVPGQVPFNPRFDATTGVTTNDIIWNFFQAHSKP